MAIVELSGYILVDVFKEIAVELVNKSAEYGHDGIINYQYGYVTELVTKLQQFSLAPKTYNLAFPLIWVKQPFTIKRNVSNSGRIFGRVTDLEIYIIQQSEKTITAEERMLKTFKPVIYPIYEGLLNEIDLHVGLGTMGKNSIVHDITDFYWWGENQQAVLNDVVDCLRISNMTFDIYYKECTPFKSI